ncbi:alpha-glucan family phosphorylase [Cytophagaceae bacterium ABcell3]|nr:alpha-glucan family phosphorylase [Cytophagaceae bacterium ABcell3]
MNINFNYRKPEAKGKKVAYFSMEFAIDQCLKIYSGGLGFLAGSHLRSAGELNQNLIGIGILYKHGYYDQNRDSNQQMRVDFIKKDYSFLMDTGIVFPVSVHDHTVMVKAFYLAPDIFGTAPLFLLSTDIPENDYLSRTITHRLYDPNEATKIAQSIVLGIGGAKLLDILHDNTDIYHMNEGHPLPLLFYLYSKCHNLEEVKRKVVFTTHTPEAAGNEEHDINLLNEMNFFYSVPFHEVKEITKVAYGNLNYTLTGLRFAKIANAVSKIHEKVANEMWKGNEGTCSIISITNAQSKSYWADKKLEEAFEKGSEAEILNRKREMKKALFEVVADQTGKLFHPDVLTVVWARRFAGYKRANLIMRNFENFLNLITSSQYPVQFIWAGKPYPEDSSGIHLFNEIANQIHPFENCAVLTGYELKLSALLKRGADVWLNTPRYSREASGTSGMSAAMNGTVNLSIADGWFPEFVKHG